MERQSASRSVIVARQNPFSKMKYYQSHSSSKLNSSRLKQLTLIAKQQGFAVEQSPGIPKQQMMQQQSSNFFSRIAANVTNRISNVAEVITPAEASPVTPADVSPGENDCSLCCQALADPKTKLPCCNQFLHTGCYVEFRQYGFNNCLLCRASLPSLESQILFDYQREDPLLGTAAIVAREVNLNLELEAHKNLDNNSAGGLVKISSPTTLATSSNENRLGIDIVVVVDVSGSMAGEKIMLVKDSLKYLISQQLLPQDRVSIVTFSSDSHVYCNFRRISVENKPELLQLVTALTAGGSTNTLAGMESAMELLEKRSQTNPMSSIILLTDGQDSFGFSPSNNAATFIKIKELRVPVQTVGYGEGHDSVLLQNIAQASSGSYVYAQSVQSVGPLFASIVGGICSVSAENIRLVLDIHPESTSTFIRFSSGIYPHDLSPKQVVLDIFNIFDSESRIFVFDFTYPESGQPMITATLTYSPVGNSGQIQIKSFILNSFIPRSQGYYQTRAENLVADALKAAIAQGDSNKLPEARGIINTAISKLDELCQSLGEGNYTFFEPLKKELSNVLPKFEARVFKSGGRHQVTQNQMQMQTQRANAVGSESESGGYAEKYTNVASKSAYSKQQKSKK